MSEAHMSEPPVGEPRKPDAGKRQGHTRNARRRSRELALQGLYQWFLNPSEVGEIDAHIRDAPGFDKADRDHYESLLHGSVHHLESLMQQIQPFVDRPWVDLSPVEKSVLVLASHEMNTHPEIPYRVVINEAVELTKTFGGTDAFKFVNGVLDKVASQSRDAEIKAHANAQGNAQQSDAEVEVEPHVESSSQSDTQPGIQPS